MAKLERTLRTLRTLVAAALLAAGLGWYLRPWWSVPVAAQSTRLLPDCATRPISLVVCNANSARRATLRNAALINNIVNALPSRINILLVVNDRNAFIVASNPWPQRVSFVELAADTAITIWPQDPFLVLCHPAGRSELLVSREFDRASDRRIAEVLAEHLGWICRASALDFEGGNIVADESHAFIGGNTIRHNALTMAEPESEIVRTFERELGSSVLVIGPVPQPIGHIDMMLTPLGHDRIALADPGWGARLASKAIADHPEDVAAFERGCEEMFFGHPEIHELGGSQGDALHAPTVLGRTGQAIADSETIAPQLDRLAEELASHGLHVCRMPFLFVQSGLPQTQPGTPATKPSENPKPCYPQLTYNNVLLEPGESGTRPVVYLPQYGWELLDGAARQAWEAQGFDVHPVSGFAISAMYGGSLRCCVKVLAR